MKKSSSAQDEDYKMVSHQFFQMGDSASWVLNKAPRRRDADSAQIKSISGYWKTNQARPHLKVKSTQKSDKRSLSNTYYRDNNSLGPRPKAGSIFTKPKLPNNQDFSNSTKHYPIYKFKEYVPNYVIERKYEKKRSPYLGVKISDFGRGIQSLHKGFNTAASPHCVEGTARSFCVLDDDYPRYFFRDRVTAEIDHLRNLWQSTSSFLYDQIPANYKFLHRLSPNNKTAFNSENVCQSVVDMTKIGLARNTEGEWKYIVNVVDEPSFVQVVVTEECLSPGSPCSYINSTSKSRCKQRFFNHNLLTWKEEIGFHVDSFSLPVACTCHVSAS